MRDEKDLMKRQYAKLMDYKNVFSSASGQKVLDDMMSAHHVLNSTYSKSATREDVLIREGERNAVLRILTILKTSPGKLREMIEQNEERK
jgi:hypothetical protein